MTIIKIKHSKLLVALPALLTIICVNNIYAQEPQIESKQISTNETVYSTLDNEQIEKEFDMNQLVERMKETKAIGFITKLSLKNQIDDFLEETAKLTKNNQQSPALTTQIKANFEGIILKTITLLNKGEDYFLAEDIYLAREQLWKSIMENKV